jgi:nitrite reductase/ring-hydroxylating ferredoxin subunit
MNKKNNVKSKSNSFPIIIASIILVASIIGIIAFKGLAGAGKENASKANNDQTKSAITSDTDLKILKSEVTETAKFYPYKAGNVNMEVFAVKAKDGTIRTALNTCQVCYASGKGYYVQKGDTLVCQNCGNVFKIDQIEKMKNGCNPVPVTGTAKKDDGTNIVVSKTFLAENKELFLKWKK